MSVEKQHMTKMSFYETSKGSQCGFVRVFHSREGFSDLTEYLDLFRSSVWRFTQFPRIHVFYRQKN